MKTKNSSIKITILRKKIDDLSKKNQVGYAYNRAKQLYEDDSLDEVEINVSKVFIKGKAYYADDNGVVYDCMTHEQVDI
jgi:hypothetical protein